MNEDEKTQFITRYKFVQDLSKPNRLMESVKVGEVYISRLTMEKNVIAGNLYHKKTNVILFVTKGRVRMKFASIKSADEKELVAEPGFGIIHHPPNTALALKNIGDEEAIVIFFSNKKLRSDDDYKYTLYE